MIQRLWKLWSLQILAVPVTQWTPLIAILCQLRNIDSTNLVLIIFHEPRLNLSWFEIQVSEKEEKSNWSSIGLKRFKTWKKSVFLMFLYSSNILHHPPDISTHKSISLAAFHSPVRSSQLFLFNQTDKLRFADSIC